jgi:hypothetical protein
MAQEPALIRAIIAVAVGLIVWASIAVGLDMLLRFALPGYAAAEPQLHLTLAMMVARLVLLGGVTSIGAGFASAWVARGDRRVVAAVAFILLVLFIPAHYRLWTTFPVWYHLTFFGSLILLIPLGARFKSLIVKS